MITGLYTSASGAVADFRRQMVVMNNLANVSTSGYKQEITELSEFSNLLMVEGAGAAINAPGAYDLIGPLGTGTELVDVALDLTQGDLQETGNELDLAITGPGFFAVQTETGVYYTRDGTFYRDALGRLTRADGGLLLGENGPITVGEGLILVDADGTVSVGGQVAGRIQLVDFDPQERLLSLGNNYLIAENPGAQPHPADQAAINQGFLERSNVDAARASVEMLAAMRSYEACLKMIQLQDQTLATAVSEVGQV